MSPASRPPPPVPGPKLSQRSPAAAHTPAAVPAQEPIDPIDPIGPIDPIEQQLSRQLSRLYGESLFGSWLDASQVLGPQPRERRRRSRLRRTAFLVVGAALAFVVVWFAKRGFQRQATEGQASVARDVASFLVDGELERLAQFVAILSPPDSPLQATDPYLDLIVQAEAALYRYHDAMPARLARIEPHVQDPHASPARVLARLTVASNAERALSYETLEGLLSTFRSSPELWSLLAAAQESVADASLRNAAAVRASWERSFALGPLWLPHRYQQCLFEARQGNVEGLTRVARHMAKVAPDSPWTHLAVRLSGDVPLPDVPSAKATPALVDYHQQLASVFEGLRNGGSSSRHRQALEHAFNAVHDGAPFVLDAFTWLTMAKATHLASTLASFESWPRKSPLAQVMLAERPEPAHGRVASSKDTSMALATPLEVPSRKPAAKPPKSGHKEQGPGAKKKGKRAAKARGRARR